MGFNSFTSGNLLWGSHDNILPTLFLSLPFPWTFTHRSPVDHCTGATLMELHAPQRLDWKRAESTWTASELCVPVPCRKAIIVGAGT